MTGPGYPAARKIAARVEQFFAQHAAAGHSGDESPAPIPTAAVVEQIVDTAFWASLRREEGMSPQISLAFLPPERAGHPLVFERPIAFKAAALAKLAPAVERPGIHLGVWPDGKSLRVWGTTRRVPSSCFVLEVAEPGVLVIKYRRGDDLDKFGTVAVLQGDEIKVIDEEGDSLPDCPALLSSLLSFDASSGVGTSVNVLVQLAVSMRAHRRGGSLLVVPHGSGAWRESAARPIPYAISPPLSELADLLGRTEAERELPIWRESFRHAVDAVAGLTAVDGAMVISDRYEVLAFGVKIVRRRQAERVERVSVSEPVIGGKTGIVDPSQLGGTRHLSAAQFTLDQRDSMALVASQDGRFTVFAWSPCEDVVHAHRVETLLM